MLEIRTFIVPTPPPGGPDAHDIAAVIRNIEALYKSVIIRAISLHIFSICEDDLYIR